MALKFAVIAFVIIAGCNAFPALQEEEDMSIFFEHVMPDARVVGGAQAANGAHPHMVAMTNGANVRNFVCGGSLISRRTVLTAAHCIVAVTSGGSLSRNLRVTVGTNRWNSGGQTYTLQGHRNHPNYHAGNIKNDLGVLHTSSNVATSNAVRVIALNWDRIGGNVNTRVAGWGRVREGGPISATLLQLNKRTVDGNVCVNEVRRIAASLNRRVPPVDPNVEICTFHSNNHGTCHGDSGSPLVHADRNQQIGIVSWGIPCARGAPDMYVRVSAFRSWIQSNTV